MRNRTKPWIKNIKDYMVPIGIFLLIFLLIYVAFSWWGDNEPSSSVWSNGIESMWINDLSLEVSDWTEAIIVNTKDKKRDVVEWENLSPWELLKVTKGSVGFSIDDIAHFNLDKNWELEYGKDSKMKLESSSLWVTSESDIEVDSRYLSAKLWPNSIANIEQNEVSSTLYLVSWSAEVKNLSWQETFLAPWKKIQVLRQQASEDELDMSSLKWDFDDYFKISDWYLKNKTSSENLLWSMIPSEGESNSESGSGNIDWEGSLIGNENTENINEASDQGSSVWLLSFENIYDEWSVDSPTTTINGSFSDDRVRSIFINWLQATINPTTQTFSVPWVDTSKSLNDIVIKVLDGDDNIIGKHLYTIYYSAGSKTTSQDSSTPSAFSKINTESYPVNASDFIISTPSIKNGKTYVDQNTFYWTVKNPNVAAVYINGHKLTTYNWRTFRYHAYKRFKTLGEWVNNYEIKYVWKDGSVILKKYISFEKVSTKQTAVAPVVKPSAIAAKPAPQPVAQPAVVNKPALVSTEANPQ